MTKKKLYKLGDVVKVSRLCRDDKTPYEEEEIDDLDEHYRRWYHNKEPLTIMIIKATGADLYSVKDLEGNTGILWDFEIEPYITKITNWKDEMGE